MLANNYTEEEVSKIILQVKSLAFVDFGRQEKIHNLQSQIHFITMKTIKYISYQEPFHFLKEW